MCSHLTNIADYSSKVFVGGRDDKCYDIEIENNGPQSNDVVEVGAGQSNQPVKLNIIIIIL